MENFAGARAEADEARNEAASVGLWDLFAEAGAEARAEARAAAASRAAGALSLIHI